MRPHASRLWKQGQALIPGGVNSPVRAFGAVGGEPVFIESGSGCLIKDVDGREYVDYVMSWGPLILGHAHPQVVDAIKTAAEKGTSFGMPTEVENLLAQRVVQCFPGMDKVRMVSSGTEAVMSAIRLARGFTDRDLVIKFEGCYHGHVDGLLAAAGSGLATFSIPGTKGVPASYTEKTIVLPYNQESAVQEAFSRYGSEIACVIVEPIAGNMGVVPPASNFLQCLRDVTDQHGSLLIFDEVITGFRVGPAGAQGLYNVKPDLTILGKILGGGLPAAAYGGGSKIMDMLSPDGPVYQAGTLSGNPLAMAAGLTVLELLRSNPPYQQLDEAGRALEEGLQEAAENAGVPVQQNRVCSMQTLFFTEWPVTDYASARKSDTEKYATFFHGMLERGVHFAPSQFEAAFVSTAHSDEHIERTIHAAREVMKEIT